MYKYVLNKKQNVIAMFNGEDKICEASILVDGKVAILDFVKLGITESDSMMSIAAKCCRETKKLLGNVDRVQFGGILEVSKYDELLEKIGKDIANSKSVNVSVR